MDAKRTRQGVIFAFIAYCIWGIAPAYFKLLKQVPAEEILTHRVIWSFFFMLFLLSLSRSWGGVRQVLATPKKVGMLLISALLVGGNWLLFIWAINHDHILEASLGYFINPLVNVLLGMLFLGERFRRLQWLAVVLAFAGVVVQLWVLGSLPILGLGISLTFAFYGLMRKKIGVDAQSGMLIETMWLLPAAGIYLFFIAHSATSNLAANALSLNLLLAAAGIITTVPLLFFTAATSRLKLSTLGFFQYLGPTLMFLLAVTFYGESVNPSQLLTFAFIWAGLGCFIYDALHHQYQLRR
ncbi:EamA family transporter RarD [Rahnella sp. SAP-1]|jgi:chloramphenicol-sensitive protein RarD|uniref:EamA family transporter RarD n=1 Tax=Rouxiella aceris TaxID=2703884 RepID=A0A848MRF0_9GAMM|nr:EamA family transporter RarD [Rouxiella aceris]NMP29666.1 EamA family transporter RarD [Rouxiella aceris]